MLGGSGDLVPSSFIGLSVPSIQIGSLLGYLQLYFTLNPISPKTQYLLTKSPDPPSTGSFKGLGFRAPLEVCFSQGTKGETLKGTLGGI